MECDRLRRGACVILLVLGSASCVSRASSDVNLAAEVVESLLGSNGLEDVWFSESYPLPSSGGHYLVEAYWGKQLLRPGICASSHDTLEVFTKDAGKQLSVVYRQQDKLVALKPCSKAARADFLTVNGDVPLEDIPDLLSDIRKAAACMGACSMWSSVDIDESLIALLAGVGRESLYQISEQKGELSLHFHFDDLPMELFVCYVTFSTGGRRHLRVMTQEIDFQPSAG
jgi:hypothetical protein